MEIPAECERLVTVGLNFKHLGQSKAKVGIALASGVKLKVRDNVVVLAYDYKNNHRKSARLDEISTALAKNLKNIRRDKLKYGQLLRLDANKKDSHSVREMFRQKQQLHQELLQFHAKKLDKSPKPLMRVLAATQNWSVLDRIDNDMKKTLNSDFKQYFLPSEQSVPDKELERE